MYIYIYKMIEGDKTTLEFSPEKGRKIRGGEEAFTIARGAVHACVRQSFRLSNRNRVTCQPFE